MNTRIVQYQSDDRKTAGLPYTCCGGCRAIAVQDGSTDYLKPDPITCAYFKGGWKTKKDALLRKLGVAE